MIPHHLSKVLLVQALEESDPQGSFLPLSTRHHATQQARADKPPSGSPTNQDAQRFLQKRTDAIWAFLSQSYPSLIQVWSPRIPHVPAWLVAIPALVAGLLINGLGTSQRVNLLNFPLLLLLVWNMGIYPGTVILTAMPSWSARIWLDLPAQWLSQRAVQWETRFSPNPKTMNSSSVHWIQEAVQQFIRTYWGETRHLWIHHLRQRLHLGAACMALGIVLGMYIRGLALDYQATWESTFLSANQVHGLLHTLLGPAAWLLNFSFPSVGDITRLQAPQHGPAAPWIHMWAITALTVIVIPRSLLAWVGHRSWRKAQKQFVLPLHDPYFVHLLASDRGQGMHVTIMPYSYQPSPPARAFLENAFLDLFGNLATLHWEGPVPFGQEIPVWPGTTSSHRTFVVVFNSGQTPEGEVQGEWLHLLQTEMNAAQPGSRLLVILDEEPYRQTIDPARINERRQAWHRLTAQYHLTLVPFDLHATSPNQFLQQAQAGLWPVRS